MTEIASNSTVTLQAYSVGGPHGWFSFDVYNMKWQGVLLLSQMGFFIYLILYLFVFSFVYQDRINLQSYILHSLQ